MKKSHGDMKHSVLMKLVVKGWVGVWGGAGLSGWQVRGSSRGLDMYSLCMHSPSVQFLDWSTMPSQSFPPFLGAGALHSLLLQWVHSVPQVDHLLHSVHRPSTATHTREEHTHTHTKTDHTVSEMVDEKMKTNKSMCR